MTDTTDTLTYEALAEIMRWASYLRRGDPTRTAIEDAASAAMRELLGRPRD